MIRLGDHGLVLIGRLRWRGISRIWRLPCYQGMVEASEDRDAEPPVFWGAGVSRGAGNSSLGGCVTAGVDLVFGYGQKPEFHNSTPTRASRDAPQRPRSASVVRAIR